MANQLESQLRPQPVSPYCFDPECQYCKELRRAQEQLMQEMPEKSIPARRSG